LNLTILHTNDLHGTLDEAFAQQIRDLKTDDSLYFDCGDCIKAGNLAIPLKPDPVWALLEKAGCDAGIPGNRESQILRSAFKAKVGPARNPLLCANLRLKSGERPLPGQMVFEKAGIKIGVIGVMVPMVTESMAAKAASAYLWDSPISTACAIAKRLRKEVDCLIALTHIGFKRDAELAEACPDLDMIFGAHSHLKLDSPARFGKVWVFQAASHGKYVGKVVWSPSDGLVDSELIPRVVSTSV
jgi:2',3'-cyclic-nucleotide 2'-phosphodiesterase (5'-nucleotidase family)